MRAMIWLAVATLGAGLVTACKDAPTKENQENQAPAANFSTTPDARRQGSCSGNFLHPRL